MVQYNSSYRPSSRSRSEGPRFRKITIFLAFLVALAAAIFLLSKILKREIVIIPAAVSYDESLTAEEKTFLEKIFTQTRLAHDVKISGKNVFTYSPHCEDESCEKTVLYDILIPVTGFYNSKIDISATEAEKLPVIENAQVPSDETKVYLTSIKNLSPEMRALSIDGNYALDIISTKDKALVGEDYKGAVFRIFELESSNPAEAKEIISSTITQFPNENTILSINQTGVTALARAMINKLNQVGTGTYFAEKIADFLKRTDFTHISNEVSFASDCTNSSSTALCSPMKMFETITAIGTDFVELTGNHNNDWGTSANIASIEKYHENDMQTFGGGINEEEASIPLKISEKGTNITWIGIDESTSTKANGQGASGDHPGANIYNEEVVKSQIKEAKDRGDFVIVDIQYFECYCYPEYGEEMPECDYPISGQKEFFRKIADMGADIIVGTQAHQPQTFEIYNGTFIYYGTGNLFFDQTYWPGTTRSIIFSHYFLNGKLIQTRLSLTQYDTTYQTHLMDTAEAESMLKRLIDASPATF